MLVRSKLWCFIDCGRTLTSDIVVGLADIVILVQILQTAIFDFAIMHITN
jgi:hypothetical protein